MLYVIRDELAPLDYEDGMPGWRLIRRFLIISLGLIGLLAIALGWVTTSYLTRIMLAREKTITADYVQRVVMERISPAELRAASSSRVDRVPVREVAEELGLLPEVVRIKVFDHEGTVIWSDAHELIGKNFRHTLGLQGSLQGEVVVTLEPITPTPEHRFEYGTYKELTSIYVPIRDVITGETLAVFEVYKLPVLLKTTISRSRTVLWIVVLAGGVLLFLGQFILVSGAARTINTQYNELLQRARELQHMNTRLQDTQSQLVEAERFAAIGEVTAAVAHGIRNPLGNIRLVTQEMQEGLDRRHPLREPLGEIIEQVDVLEARLRSFLSTVKPFELSLSFTPLAVLVEHALEGIRQGVQEQGVAVSIELEKEQMCIHCDAVKIEEALQELLVNGVEAGASKIWITAQQVPDDMSNLWVRMVIEDNGVGMSPDAARKIFQPFFTTKAFGTGLGLVVAKKVIEAHGGRLVLEARASGGTKAIVWLPCHSASSEE
jgi:signal transduction histidine kinase/cell division protein FtsL